MNSTRDGVISSNKFKVTEYIFVFFLLVFVIVLALKFSDLEKFVKILSGGIWYYILLFIFLQLLYLLVQSEVYLGLYRIFGKTGNLIKTLQVFLATNFVNLALPFSGVSGVVTFVGYSKELGLSRLQALIINIIFYILVFLSFSLMILFILFFPNELVLLNTPEKITIFVFYLMIISLTVVFLIMVTSEKISGQIVKFSANFINFFSRRFVRKEVIDKKKSQLTIGQIKVLRLVINEKKRIFLAPFFYSLFGHLLHFLVFYIIFLAFGSAVSPLVALIGYIISVVFIVVSFTPSGVGIVEPLMILYFVSAGISVELATIVTFVFRGVVFWLPFFLGFLAIRQMRKTSKQFL